jgi:hypothetical protein
MLRKALFLLAGTLVAFAIPLGAGAADSLLDYQSAVDALVAIDPTISPPPTTGGKDFAVGGFHGQENNNVGFSAHSGPLGEDPEGHLSETRPHFFVGTSPSTFQGRFRVTCLTVIGNEAGIGLVPTDATSNDQTAEFVLAVRDNGLPGGTGDEYSFVPDVPASDCAVGVGLAFFPIESGNINVKDALP